MFWGGYVSQALPRGWNCDFRQFRVRVLDLTCDPVKIPPAGKPHAAATPDNPGQASMHCPSIAEYSDALLLSLDVVLSDPLLGRGALRMRGPGLPVAHSGNFAATFEVVVDGKTYAVRCFRKPSDSLRLDPESVFCRLRVPAIRDHHRGRPVSDRPDGVGGRPVTCGVRGRTPQ